MLDKHHAPFDLRAWLAGLAEAPPIVQAGAGVLRRRARELGAELFGTPELAQLVRVMVEAMRDAPGVGLAAPQLGVPLRVYVAEDLEERVQQMEAASRTARARVALPLMVLVNPVVTPLSEDQVTFFEGCLSVRGYGALVPRYTAVRAEGYDIAGHLQRFELKGWPARIMQHEMDHLNGTLYIDRMLSRSFANEAELGRLSALPVSEVMSGLVTPES
jgi:peptide deformylase